MDESTVAGTEASPAGRREPAALEFPGCRPVRMTVTAPRFERLARREEISERLIDAALACRDEKDFPRLLAERGGTAPGRDEP